jgi:hypothetical protein
MPILIMRCVPVTETASANGVNTLLRSVGTSLSSAAAAAITTQLAVGEGFPSVAELTSIFWVAAGACGVGTVLAAFVRRVPAGDGSLSAVPLSPAGI